MSRRTFFFVALIVSPFLSPWTHASPLVIGEIQINRKNVFEGTGRENVFPYSWGNKLHFVTRESYIRRELLFKTGDPFDPDLIQESERMLRRRPIFRYVSIVPQEPRNGKVDIVVNTEDVWTTSLRLSYGTAGGKHFYSLGILERNLLGQGITTGAFVEQDIDRLRRGLSFSKTHIFGTPWLFFGGYGRDEKGREYETLLEKPFRSALDRHSEGVALRESEDEDRLFDDGREIAKFQHEEQELRVSASFAFNPRTSKIRRPYVAYHREEDRFSDIKLNTIGAQFPPERIVSAGVAGLDYQNIRFVKERGVMTFDRDEDINLGAEWLVEAGPSKKKWGATEDSTLGRLQWQKIFNPRPRRIWFNHIDVDGRYESDRVQDGVLRVRSQFFILRWLDENTVSLRGEFSGGKNLDPENQFVLGGENGLRGYSVRQFGGDKRLLVTLENRQVVWYDLFHLITIGWAVFADTGATWQQSDSLAWRDLKTDVGAGIRFAPSRSVDPGLIRFDLAYALQENNRSSRLVVNIGADLHFGDRRQRKFDQ